MKSNIFSVTIMILCAFSCKAQQTATATGTGTVGAKVETGQTTPAAVVAPAATIETLASIDTDLPPASFGSIRGKVVYKGGPIRKELNVIKDEHTCGSESLLDESLLTDADGGLQWAVVSIGSEVENGKGLDQLPGERRLDQLTCVYQPHVVLVGTGQQLTINNLDHTLHNVRTASFMNSVVNKVQIYMPNMPHPSDKVTFNEPEVIEVLCDVHGWMKAYVHVVEHPYFAVSGTDGGFELAEVPPGKYTLTAWHEKLGNLEQQVEVKAGEDTVVSFGYNEVKK